MKRRRAATISTRHRFVDRSGKLGIAIAGVLAWGTSAALGDAAHGTPSTLALTPKSPPRVGQSTIIQATGYNSPTGEGSAYGHFYLDVDALPASFGSTCPSGYLDGAQSAQAQLAVARPETMDASGNFSIPVVINSTAPGKLLICGYTDDGTSLGTAASYSLPITIAPASSRKGHPHHKKKKHRRRTR